MFCPPFILHLKECVFSGIIYHRYPTDGKKEGIFHMAVNRETLKQLIAFHAFDSTMTGIIVDVLESFESYHQAIYTMEVRRQLRLHGAMDDETYREEIPRLDRVRTARHNTVISNVGLLNRLAAQAGLAPFYEGEVSEERPYRTQLADAVLLFVREIIEERITGAQ